MEEISKLRSDPGPSQSRTDLVLDLERSLEQIEIFKIRSLMAKIAPSTLAANTIISMIFQRKNLNLGRAEYIF